MKYIKLFEQFIVEGGWSTVKTQQTILNPANVKKTVEVIERIGQQFNKHLVSIDLPPLDIVRPVGSGTWWEQDLEEQPNKVYGDVDFLVAYPTLKLEGEDEKKNEAATVRLYNDELISWLEKAKPNGIDVEESKNISNPSSIKLIAEIDVEGTQGYVQVDLVVTHIEYKDWALARLTPVRNIKGFVLGNLYSSFGEVLDLSVQLKGVRAKLKGDTLVPYSKRAGVEEILVSKNIQTFLLDIAQFFWQQESKSPFKPNRALVSWKMDTNNPSIQQLMQGIQALADQLDALDQFGGSIKYKSKSEFMKAVADRYEQKMMTTYNASKFDKAESDEAKKTVEKIRKMITEHIKLVRSLA